MIGAIAGDIIGAPYERHNITVETGWPLFDEGARSRFTDDTVLTVATADAILTGADYGAKYREWYRRYPDRGFGPGFRRWAGSDRDEPYGSLGNGSAMRVSPVAWAFDALEEVLGEARRSAEVTHNHPEGIQGAQAVAAAVFLARTGSPKDEIRAFVEGTFGYRLDIGLDELRAHHKPDATCPGSVPQALTAFLVSSDWEDAVRKAVSLGGDSDTVASMAGAVAEAFYGGVPPGIRDEALGRLDEPLLRVVRAFCRAVGLWPGEPEG